MSTSAVPPIQWTDAGVVLPQESAILAGVQTDINNAFGGGVNPTLTTPQGQIASSTTAIIAEKNSEIAHIANQVDPRYATGRFQDAIGYFYFMTRKPSTSTVVTCTLTGPAGTIPAGVFAQDTAGNTYVLMAPATIPSGGSVTGTIWNNIVTGPIPCAANSMRVYQSAGFDTIVNPAPGVPGQNVESPSEFEARRQASVALNGRGTVQSIYANVFAVAGVTNAFVIDNPTGSTVNSGSTNYPLAPHSIYVAVVGGDPQAVAQAIWNKKDVGASYSAWPSPPSGPTVPGDGTVVTETVIDTTYQYPQPSYKVSFIEPASTPIFISVSIVNQPSLPANIATLIQNAIIAQFNGTNGATPVTIASLILAASYYAAIASVGSNVLILDVTVGITASPTATSYQAGIDQIPTISASDIVVTLV